MLDLDARSLYDVAYALLMQHATLYEEQAKAMAKVKTRIRNAINQFDTGLPPIAALVPPVSATPRSD